MICQIKMDTENIKDFLEVQCVNALDICKIMIRSSIKHYYDTNDKLENIIVSAKIHKELEKIFTFIHNRTFQIPIDNTLISILNIKYDMFVKTLNGDITYKELLSYVKQIRFRIESQN